MAAPVAAPRLAPAVPVPLTTGVAADGAFAFGAALRSPGFFAFFALDEGLSPGLLAAPIPSDFMADGECDVLFSDTLLVLFTVGLSGAAEKHFVFFDCRGKKNNHTNQKTETREKWNNKQFAVVLILFPISSFRANIVPIYFIMRGFLKWDLLTLSGKLIQ